MKISQAALVLLAGAAFLPVCAQAANQTPAEILQADFAVVKLDSDFVASAKAALMQAYQSGDPTNIAAAQSNLTASWTTLTTAREQLATDRDTINAGAEQALAGDRAALDAIRVSITSDIDALASGSVTTAAQLTADVDALFAERAKTYADFAAYFGASGQPPAGTTGALIAADKETVRTEALVVHDLKGAIAAATPAVAAQLQPLLVTAETTLKADQTALADERQAADAAAATELAAARVTVKTDHTALDAAERQLAKDVAADNTAAIAADQALVTTAQDELAAANKGLRTDRIDALDWHPAVPREAGGATSASVTASAGASANSGSGRHSSKH